MHRIIVSINVIVANADTSVLLSLSVIIPIILVLIYAPIIMPII